MTARCAHGPYYVSIVKCLSAVLASLVAYRTGSLAGGLAGGLAFAAAAFFHCVLQFPGI